MKRNFKVGDHVQWNSEAGRVRGTIKKRIISAITFKGYRVHASKEEPQYLIKSDKTDEYLAVTATEVLAELKPPPQRLFADLTNYLRFRLSPNSAIAVAARVKRPGKQFVGQQEKLYLVEEQLGEESPYERLLDDAMAGDGALFTREDAVEAAWAVVDQC